MQYDRMDMLQRSMGPEDFWRVYGDEIMGELRSRKPKSNAKRGNGRELLSRNRRPIDGSHVVDVLATQ